MLTPRSRTETSVPASPASSVEAILADSPNILMGTPNPFFLLRSRLALPVARLSVWETPVLENVDSPGSRFAQTRHLLYKELHSMFLLRRQVRYM